MRDRIALGRRGEDLAAARLEEKGYHILDRNVRSRYGEIDLVARDGDCIVFVEVRTVSSAFLAPEESVTHRKQRRMSALGMHYLQKHGSPDTDWRADVVAIELDREGRPSRVEHYVNAVEE